MASAVRRTALRCLATSSAALLWVGHASDEGEPDEARQQDAHVVPGSLKPRAVEPGFRRPAECFSNWGRPSPQLDFERVYSMGPEIGHGAYASVHTCVNKQNRHVSAVKVFQKKGMSSRAVNEIREEAAIMESLAHPNIVRVLGSFEDPAHFYVVMELCQGGELFDRIVSKTVYNELEARNVIQILLEAVAYCHNHGVVHRDIKPENLLLVSPEDDTTVKIADFGLAARFEGTHSLARNCGTPGYTAPEVLQGKPYDEGVDCWSVGVLAFILLGGYQPFGEDDAETIKGDYSFEAPQWKNVSEEAKDLIRSLLVVDPNKRMSAQEALHHPWIHQEERALRERDLTTTHRDLKKFNAKRRFRAAVDAVRQRAREGQGADEGAEGAHGGVVSSDVPVFGGLLENLGAWENVGACGRGVVAETGVVTGTDVLLGVVPALTVAKAWSEVAPSTHTPPGVCVDLGARSSAATTSKTASSQGPRVRGTLRRTPPKAPTRRSNDQKDGQSGNGLKLQLPASISDLQDDKECRVDCSRRSARMSPRKLQLLAA